jgi:hypothetical protein
VELQENYKTFQTLNTEIIAIAQEESDPTTMVKVEEFVQNDFIVVADPSKSSRKAFKRYGMYFIDRKGMIQSWIPGTKTARPRLDLIVKEAARIAGKEAPSIENKDGKIEVEDPLADLMPKKKKSRTSRKTKLEDVLEVRWMWSHNQVSPGEDLKLAFCPLISEGYHVYGARETKLKPFRLKLDLPKGLTLVKPITYPKAEIKDDPVLKMKLQIYHEDIPIDTLRFKAEDSLKPGDYTIKATIEFQACDGATCLMPGAKVVTIPLKVAPKGQKRQQVYGWGSW